MESDFSSSQEVPTGKRVGFVELPDEALEIFSHFTQSPVWSASVITSRGQDTYAVRMARVLGVPVESEPSAELLADCDLVIVGGEAVDRIETVREMLADTGIEILDMNTAADRLGIPLADEVTSGDPSDSEIEEADLCMEMEKPDFGELGMDSGSEVDARFPETPDTGDEDFLTALPESDVEVAESDSRAEDVPEISSPATAGTPGLTWDQIDSGNAALEKKLEEILTATGAESGSIMLPDRDGEHLGIAVSIGLPKETIKKSRPRVGSGLAGQAFASGKPRSRKAEIPTLAEVGGVPRCRIAASTPITRDGQMLGVLSVNVETEEDLSEAQLTEKLSGFLPSVEETLFRAIKFSSMSWEMKESMLFEQVDRIMSLEESFPERLKVLSDVLQDVLQADAVHLYLYDALSKRLELVTEPHGMAVSRYQPVDRGLFGWALKSGATRMFLARETESSNHRGIVCINIRTTRPYGLLVLENVYLEEGDDVRLTRLLDGIVSQLVEIFELEQGVTTQDILSGLRMRIADQASRLDILPPELRIQPALELAIELLAAEVAFWIPGAGEHPVIAQPRTQRAAKILAEAWERFEGIGDWVRENEAGQYIGGENGGTGAPEGPAPYIAVKSQKNDAVLLLMYDSEENAGPFSQLPFHLLTEVLYTICEVIEREGQGKEKEPEEESRELGPPDGVRVLTRDQLKRRIQEEQMRSSRTGLPFSLTRVEYLQGEVPEKDQAFLAKFLLTNKRKTDFVGEVDTAVFVVLSPDTDPDADGLGYRLRECWREQGSKTELSIERCYLPDFKPESRTTATQLDKAPRIA